MSYLSHLECPRCGEEHSADKPINLCQCGGPLLARYDLKRLTQKLSPADLRGRVATMWRYREFLPVEDGQEPVTLGEGCTPTFPLNELGKRWGMSDLMLKDEGLCPTGTFKARGAAAGITRAKALGIAAVAMPTAGNAGGAWSAYGARAGMEVIIAMPADAPEMAKKECIAYGAKTFLVDGLISDAGKMIAAGAKEHGWFEVSTLKEPYRIEGKKTMGLEIAEDSGWGDLPDVVIYPTGGGVGIIGIWKALAELEEVGWISGKKPKMVAVQSDGCAPIVEAFEAGRRDSDFWEGAQTLAGGIRVPKALGDFLVLDAIRESGGTALTVSDEEIVAAHAELAEVEGALICPEGAAAAAAAKKLREDGFIAAGDRVLILNTGSGLKYPEMTEVNLEVLPKGGRLPV